MTLASVMILVGAGLWAAPAPLPAPLPVPLPAPPVFTSSAPSDVLPEVSPAITLVDETKQIIWCLKHLQRVVRRDAEAVSFHATSTSHQLALALS